MNDDYATGAVSMRVGVFFGRPTMCGPARVTDTISAVDGMLTQSILKEQTLSYVKSYIAINVAGNNYLWLHKRSQGKSLLGFRMSLSLQDDDATLLDSRKITYVRKPKRFLLTVDKEFVETHAEVFKSIAGLVKMTWEGDV